MPQARTSKTFGEQVRAVRERKGWTQDRLCAELEKLGEPMDRATVARIEAGKRGVSVDDLMLFALALGVAPVYLVLPRATAPVTLASGVTVNGWEALQWMRGVYALDLTEAPDAAAAAASDDVRFYYESCPDYEAAAIRRFPLVRDLWHVSALAMTYAADDAARTSLRRTLQDIGELAALALAHLDVTDKEN